ncbi:MAG: Glutathione transport system permease protein GsiD [Anaerolineales bacterium]|nr:Glutathione transport system permease protein GsiD [Anaerolineales bacterium]
MTEAVSISVSAPRAQSRSLLGEAWHRFRQQRPAMLGLIILLMLVLAAIAAPLLTSYDPDKQKLVDVLIHPNAPHPLGTDHLGRDVLARLLYGGRLSLMIGLLAVGIGLLVGMPLGAVSGYYGGWVDMIVQRVADILLSFPSILLALSLVAVLGVGLRNVIISVGVSAVPRFIRIVRGSVLTIREQTYVEAARAVGVKDHTILRRHILINALAPVIVQATLSLGSAILTAAGLGFLGLGVQPPTAEWGAMLGEGRQYIFSASYMATFPGIAIFLAVLGFNLMGDGLRDALDPRLRE